MEASPDFAFNKDQITFRALLRTDGKRVDLTVVERSERVEATGLSGVGVGVILLVILVAGFVLFIFRHRQ